MIVTRGQIVGPCIISEDTEFHGQITDDTTVNPGVTMIIHGQIAGDLIVSEQSNVILHGQVCGNVINNGGNLEVYGMIIKHLIKRGGVSSIKQEGIILNQ